MFYNIPDQYAKLLRSSKKGKSETVTDKMSLRTHDKLSVIGYPGWDPGTYKEY